MVNKTELNMKRIVLRTKGKTFLIGPEDVLYCKAAGSYSVIFLANNEDIATSMNLLNLFDRLKGLSTVLRVSQSFLVNMLHVRCIHHDSKEIELRNATKIPYTLTIKNLGNELARIFPLDSVSDESA